MGNSSSRRTPEEEKRRQLEAHGVLIPPSFGVGSGGIQSLSTLVNASPHPDSFSLLISKLPHERLLNEYWSTGVYVSAQTGDGHVFASFQPAYEHESTNVNYEGLLRASQTLDKAKVDIFANTMSSPRISGYYPLWSNSSLLHGTMHTSGHGWIGFHVDRELHTGSMDNEETTSVQYDLSNNLLSRQENQTENEDKNNAIIKLGSWLQFDASEQILRGLTGFSSIHAKGYKAAIQATFPANSWHDPKLSYIASFDVNSDGPPLTVTMCQSETKNTMALSQIVTFDRYVTNILEDRCPKIRNTLAWAVKLETLDRESQIMAGAAWQINRGLAVKLLASPHSGLTGNILLKRWKEPRVTLGLQLHLNGSNGIGFKGIGLELETGKVDWESSKDDLYFSESSKTQASGETPETKTVLPTRNGGQTAH